MRMTLDNGLGYFHKAHVLGDYLNKMELSDSKKNELVDLVADFVETARLDAYVQGVDDAMQTYSPIFKYDKQKGKSGQAARIGK